MPSLLDRLAPALSHEFRIERPLGTGATATVYLAHDLKHDRLVALKALRPELALAVGADRFLREIRTAARLHHPGIVPVLDSGEIDGLLYFTMPYVRGESLRQLLQRSGQLPVSQTKQLVRDVAAALGAAHRQGVIHRDVKPENILLEDGRAMVADFGLALALEESGSSRLTQSGVAVGTPQYMSPEQSRGIGVVDQRSDLYSLACVAYEMLAGAAPFRSATARAVMQQHIEEVPAPMRARRRDVPAALESAIEQALAKAPGDRFPTVAAFAAALDDPKRRRRRRPLSKTARRAVTTAAVVASLSAGAGLWLESAHPAGLRDRDWVLVADFEAPAEDPALGPVVRELVTAELNQSRRTETMPRQQLAGALKAAGLAETTSVNLDLARELAFRSAVRAVIGGRVERSPAGYALTLRAVDAESGRELAVVSGTASGDSLISAVQRTGRALRRALGERQSDLAANKLLLDIATPSLPAYRAYVSALALKQLGDVAGSNRLLRAAITSDTAFAAAYAVMGMNYLEARNLDSARLALAEALRRPDRLSTAQRYRLQGDAAYALNHDLAGAIHWYDRYVAETPGTVGGYNNRGFYLALLGRYEEALADFERAAANNPLGPTLGQAAIMNATDILLLLGRVDRASAKARDLTGAYAQYAALRLRLAADDWTGADSVAAVVLSSPTTPPLLRLEATTARAGILAARDSTAQADRMLAAAAAAAAPPGRYWYENARSLLALASGRRPTGGAMVPSDSAPGALVARGIRLAVLGDAAGARQARDRLRAAPAGQRERLGYGPAAIEALLAGLDGRWDSAAALLTAGARAGEHDQTMLERIPAIVVRLVTATAYARLGQTDSAIAYRQLALSPLRVPTSHLALRGFVIPFDPRRARAVGRPDPSTPRHVSLTPR